MADVAAYDSLLAEVIKASRLSGSKVKTLTELALSLVQHDTHLVTSLYKQFKARTRKSPQRISALYVFDAIARGSRSAVRASKSKTRETGTPGGLLSKMEGILDGIVEGMVDDGWQEGKDKLRKVSDIWQKAGTFSPAAIERIQARLHATPPLEPEPVEDAADDLDDGPSYAEAPLVVELKETGTKPTSTPTTTVSVPTPVPAAGLPASIMALLGKQAASGTNASLNGNGHANGLNPTTPAAVDIAALLANVSKVVQPLVPTPPRAQPQHQQPQYQQPQYQQSQPQQQQYQQSYQQTQQHSQAYQQYPSQTPFPQQQAYNSPQAGPSRQRTPPRARDPRERSKSPQRRSPAHRDPRVARDPRASTDPRAAAAAALSAPVQVSEPVQAQPPVQTPLPETVATRPNPSSAVTYTSTPPFSQTPARDTRVTLQTFDFTTFDGTKPESWSALAQAWTNTTGAEPNQMQLMMFISTGQIMPGTSMGPGNGMGVGRF